MTLTRSGIKYQCMRYLLPQIQGITPFVLYEKITKKADTRMRVGLHIFQPIRLVAAVGDVVGNGCVELKLVKRVWTYANHV